MTEVPHNQLKAEVGEAWTIFDTVMTSFRLGSPLP